MAISGGLGGLWLEELLRNFVLSWLSNQTQRRRAAVAVLFIRVNQFKSSAYEIARNVLRSRKHFAEKTV